MKALAVLALLGLAACGGSGATAPARAVAAGGVCPDADPARDGPLVDAIRTGDARPVQAALARDPADARARAALAIVTGQGRPDPDQAACFAPYLEGVA